MILSIITINYNNAEGLRKTLASVDVQTYRDIEHIIIDAASSDGSVDVIKGYADSSKHTVIWSSKKDNGIYNAMNKGVKKATGDYVWILNSGDCAAAPDVIGRMMALLNDGKFDILIGNKLHVYPGDKEERESRKVGSAKPHLMDVSMLTFYKGTVPQDAAFVRRNLFEKYGCFDDKLKIVSDWKLYLNMIALGDVKPMYVNIDVVLFDMTGVSNSNIEQRNAEKRAYLKEVLPASVLQDYDAYAFPIEQYNRLKKYHFWPIVYFIERVFFKLEKWHILK